MQFILVPVPYGIVLQNLQLAGSVTSLPACKLDLPYLTFCGRCIVLPPSTEASMPDFFLASVYQSVCWNAGTSDTYISISRLCVVILLKCPSLQNIRGPNTLQMYAWPAVFQGCDVVGVSASGKTTSYLLPLHINFQQKSNYCNLPQYGLGVSFD